MNELVIIFLALLALAFVAARVVRQRPKSEFELAVERITAAFDEFRLALGEALTPAVRQTTAAIQGFADAFRAAEETDTP